MFQGYFIPHSLYLQANGDLFTRIVGVYRVLPAKHVRVLTHKCAKYLCAPGCDIASQSCELGHDMRLTLLLMQVLFSLLYH